MEKEIDEIASSSTILDGDLNRVAVALLHPNDFIAQPCALTEGRHTIWNDEVRDRFHQVYLDILHDHAHSQAHSHAHTHTQTQTHTHAHTHAHSHAHTLTHTTHKHTHKHTH